MPSDIEQLGKNQEALQKNFEYLKREFKRLDQRIVSLEGGQPTPVEAARDKPVVTKTVAPMVAKKAGKETAKPVENLGFKIFGGVGFFLILISLFYFYSYAVGRGWVNEAQQIGIGVVASLVILGIGEFSRLKEYKNFSMLVTGGGFALLFFTVFASYFFEQYRAALGMTLTLNSILLLLVVLIAVALGYYRDSKLMTIYAFVLGYIAAFLGGNAGSTTQMLVYIVVLTAGFLAIIWKKGWKEAYLPLIGSQLLYVIFFFGGKTAPVESFLTIIFLFIIFAVYTSTEPKNAMLLVITNAVLFFLFGLSLIYQHWSNYKGFFAVGLGIVSWFLCKLAQQRENKLLSKTYQALAIAFVTLAIPLQLAESLRESITVIWAVEGVALFLLGNLKERPVTRVASYIVLVLGYFNALLFDIGGDLPMRLVGTGIMILALIFLSFHEENIALKNVMTAAWTILLTILLAVESLDSAGILASLNDNGRLVTLSILWGILAVAFIVLAFWEGNKTYQVIGIALFAITVFKVMFLDLQDLETIYRVLVTVVVGLLAVGISFVYIKNKEFIEERFKK